MDENSNDVEQADDEFPTYEVSDEALEASGTATPAFTFSLSQPGLFTCAVGCC